VAAAGPRKRANVTRHGTSLVLWLVRRRGRRSSVLIREPRDARPRERRLSASCRHGSDVQGVPTFA